MTKARPTVAAIALLATGISAPGAKHFVGAQMIPTPSNTASSYRYRLARFVCSRQMLYCKSAGEVPHRPHRLNRAVAPDGREAEQGGFDLSLGPEPLSW